MAADGYKGSVSNVFFPSVSGITVNILISWTARVLWSESFLSPFKLIGKGALKDAKADLPLVRQSYLGVICIPLDFALIKDNENPLKLPVSVNLKRLKATVRA